VYCLFIVLKRRLCSDIFLFIFISTTYINKFFQILVLQILFLSLRATFCFTNPDYLSPQLTRISEGLLYYFADIQSRGRKSIFCLIDGCTKGEAPETVLSPCPVTQNFAILSEMLLAASVPQCNQILYANLTKCLGDNGSCSFEMLLQCRAIFR
jgi:hypothetical protein